LELTEELKLRALALAKPDEDGVRMRAREIWEENGQPSGMDEEFWYQAEREFREAEHLAIHADEDASASASAHHPSTRPTAIAALSGGALKYRDVGER
jgi:hypothetical protein